LRRSQRPIIIASRRSLLARVQAEWIGARLGAMNPHVSVEYDWIESLADQRTDVALAELHEGGKALFATAVEQALLEKRADIAVHSLKDMPSTDTPGLILAATPKRVDARDALIVRDEKIQSLYELPDGAVVGTASPRRAAQLLNLWPNLKIELLRGNVQTRLKKVLEEGQFDATLLAMAGLTRLDLTEHTTRPIDPSVILPPAGQGALAIQCRGDDSVTISRLLHLNDATTAEAVHAERQVVAALGGDCHSPIAVHVEPTEVGRYRVRARVISPDGKRMVEADESATGKALRRVVKQVVKQLKADGAGEILEEASGG